MVKRYIVERSKDVVEVLLVPHKDGSGYSYVNLTKGHICQCKFDTIKEAYEDMITRTDTKRVIEVKDWSDVNGH